MAHAPRHRLHRTAFPGLSLAAGESPRARLIEQRWRWPTLLALTATIPAFYEELLLTVPPTLAAVAYALAALVTAAALLHTASASGRWRAHLSANSLDLMLVAGLLLAAFAPPSSASLAALSLRLGVAFLTLIHMVWAMQHLFTRGGMAYMMAVAALILGLCGIGFWWLEPNAQTLAQGLWLAFTTAATVGYGDIVPSTPASRIFSVFVVLLGYGVLSLVTAAIATNWVETEERIIEREILRDIDRQMDSLREAFVALRCELQQARAASSPAGTPATTPTTGADALPPPA